MTPAEVNKLTDALRRKGAYRPCARCGHNHFSVLGDLKINLATTPGEGLRGFFGGAVDAVVVGCSNCGYIITHAKTALLDPTAPRGLLG
jgi:hypothetical protein